MLFDMDKEVKKKDDLTEWHKTAKPFINGGDFKQKLIQRIKKEEITERQ